VDRLLTKQQAADLLSVSVRTLDRMRSTGEIQATMVRGSVRFAPDAIERYIAKHTVRRGTPAVSTA
jgi:excisionase family DNA binding protein